MSTPTYLGKGQPLGQSGLLGKLGAYFGAAEVPAYTGEGQPSAVATRGSLLGAVAPAYAVAPKAEPSAAVDSQAAAPCDASDEPATVMCPIDPEALAAGQIAIVIPRQGT